MVTIYKKPNPDRIKVFLTIDNNKITSVTVGNNAIVKDFGIQFYLDDYVADQIDKFNVDIKGLKPTLYLKDGEKLDFPPKEKAKQAEIRKLEQRLRQLKAE